MNRLVVLFIGLAAFGAAQAAPASVNLTWLGQAAFVMETSTDLKVLMDPMNMGGYHTEPVEGVDVVTVTHEHHDHNAVELALGDPTILKGLEDGDCASIDETIKGVRIRTVASYHDTEQGAQRGNNAIFVFELPDLKVVHLGDLGHVLSANQVHAIGRADVLLIPVSGGPTIGPETAVEVARQLGARVIIPMHYGTAAMGGGGEGGPGGRPGFSLGGVDAFLDVLDEGTQVVRPGHTVTLTAGELPEERTVMVIDYE